MVVRVAITRSPLGKKSRVQSLDRLLGTGENAVELVVSMRRDDAQQTPLLLYGDRRRGSGEVEPGVRCWFFASKPIQSLLSNRLNTRIDPPQLTTFRDHWLTTQEKGYRAKNKNKEGPQRSPTTRHCAEAE